MLLSCYWEYVSTPGSMKNLISENLQDIEGTSEFSNIIHSNQIDRSSVVDLIPTEARLIFQSVQCGYILRLTS